MSSREFTDPDGICWTVWPVIPGEMSTKLRHASGFTDEHRTPWLAFRSAQGERRRLPMVPDGWESCDAGTLAAWAARAVPVPSLPALRPRDP